MSPVIYGIHPVREALQSSPLQFNKILVGTRKLRPSLRVLLDLAVKRQIPVVFTTREEIDKLTQGGLHQSVVGLLKEVPAPSLQELLSLWKQAGGKALFLVLDGIQDPQNLGSLIRTTLGCGGHGVILPKDRAAGVTPVVVKASAGASAHLPIVKVVNIANTLDLLKQEGVWIYGASGDAGDVLYDLDLTVDLAIVIGAEGKGIRPLVRRKCDRVFSIPMKGPLSSFNASVSGGMILYEVMRQREYPDRSRTR